MPDMPMGFAEMPVIALDSNRCVVVGGFNHLGDASTYVYEFDLEKRRWRHVGNLNQGRRQHAAYRLSPTEIVVVGGRESGLGTLASAEIFNLSTGRSRNIAPFPSPINGAVYGLMSDGRGVVCGGRDGGPNDARIPGVYSYSVSGDSWELIGSLPSGREAPVAMRIRSGQFIVIGGSLSESPVNFTGECILEENGVFRTFGEIPYGATYAGLSERGDNRVLVVGGWLSDLTSTALCTYIDVATGAIAAGPTLNVPRRYVRSVTLEGPAGTGLQTFAISGVSNTGSENTIEILETKCIDDVNVVLPGVRIVGSASQTPSGIQLTSSAKY